MDNLQSKYELQMVAKNIIKLTNEIASGMKIAKTDYEKQRVQAKQSHLRLAQNSFRHLTDNTDVFKHMTEGEFREFINMKVGVLNYETIDYFLNFASCEYYYGYISYNHYDVLENMFLDYSDLYDYDIFNYWTFIEVNGVYMAIREM